MAKVALEIMLEWSNIMPLRVKAHFFGDFLRSGHYIWYDFVIHFWLYFLATLAVYLTFKYTTINKRLLIALILVFITFILLHQHNFQFPKKQYYFPSEIDFNFKLVEEFLIYLVSGLTIILLVRRRLIQSGE
ncbi:MAG: hypothetical protein RIM99_12785 [Cyclobacteriaceae bacterium]